MAEEQTTTIQMMYNGKLERISRPADARYEDFLEIAIERFAIPVGFKDFIQISNEREYIFEKDIFDYYILLFPNPNIIFHIRVDYNGLLGNLRSKARRPFSGLNNKRKRRDEDEDDCLWVPVTRQNCFLGSLPGNDSSDGTDEPKVKRTRTEIITSKATVVRKTPSRKSIRI